MTIILKFAVTCYSFKITYWAKKLKLENGWTDLVLKYFWKSREGSNGEKI